MLVVARDLAGGSARVRVLALVPAWRDAGVEVRTLGWSISGRRAFIGRAVQLVRSARWADAVILQKPTQPSWLLRLVRAAGAAIIVDVDDAVWVGSTGVVTKASERTGRRLIRAAGEAAAVVAGSRWLAAWIERGAPGARVEVRGSAVDVAALAAAPRTTSTPPVIGWIGSGGNLRDLHPAFVAGLRPLLDEGLASFLVVCDRAPSLGEVPVRWAPWSEAAEAALLATMDVGVMPLLDDERARGRCSYKALQYLAAGAAPVASPVGGAVEVVRDGETGLLATTAEQWEGALRSLVADPQRRAALVAGGRQLVGEQHDVAGAATWWLELLDEVAW